eukprot:PhM_4_TR18046/c0_g1_i8/m.97351
MDWTLNPPRSIEPRTTPRTSTSTTTTTTGGLNDVGLDAPLNRPNTSAPLPLTQQNSKDNNNKTVPLPISRSLLPPAVYPVVPHSEPSMTRAQHNADLDRRIGQITAMFQEKMKLVFAQYAEILAMANAEYKIRLRHMEIARQRELERSRIELELSGMDPESMKALRMKHLLEKQSITATMDKIREEFVNHSKRVTARQAEMDSVETLLEKELEAARHKIGLQQRVTKMRQDQEARLTRLRERMNYLLRQLEQYYELNTNDFTDQSATNVMKYVGARLRDIEQSTIALSAKVSKQIKRAELILSKVEVPMAEAAAVISDATAMENKHNRQLTSLQKKFQEVTALARQQQHHHGRTKMVEMLTATPTPPLSGESTASKLRRAIRKGQSTTGHHKNDATTKKKKTKKKKGVKRSKKEGESLHDDNDDEHSVAVAGPKQKGGDDLTETDAEDGSTTESEDDEDLSEKTATPPPQRRGLDVKALRGLTPAQLEEKMHSLLPQELSKELKEDEQRDRLPSVFRPTRTGGGGGSQDVLIEENEDDNETYVQTYHTASSHGGTRGGRGAKLLFNKVFETEAFKQARRKRREQLAQDVLPDASLPSLLTPPKAPSSLIRKSSSTAVLNTKGSSGSSPVSGSRQDSMDSSSHRQEHQQEQEGSPSAQSPLLQQQTTMPATTSKLKPQQRRQSSLAPTSRLQQQPKEQQQKPLSERKHRSSFEPRDVDFEAIAKGKRNKTDVTDRSLVRRTDSDGAQILVGPTAAVRRRTSTSSKQKQRRKSSSTNNNSADKTDTTNNNETLIINDGDERAEEENNSKSEVDDDGLDGRSPISTEGSTSTGTFLSSSQLDQHPTKPVYSLTERDADETAVEKKLASLKLALDGIKTVVPKRAIAQVAQLHCPRRIGDYLPFEGSEAEWNNATGAEIVLSVDDIYAEALEEQRLFVEENNAMRKGLKEEMIIQSKEEARLRAELARTVLRNQETKQQLEDNLYMYFAWKLQDGATLSDAEAEARARAEEAAARGDMSALLNLDSVLGELRSKLKSIDQSKFRLKFEAEVQVTLDEDELPKRIRKLFLIKSREELFREHAESIREAIQELDVVSMHMDGAFSCPACSHPFRSCYFLVPCGHLVCRDCRVRANVQRGTFKCPICSTISQDHIVTNLNVNAIVAKRHFMQTGFNNLTATLDHFVHGLDMLDKKVLFEEVKLLSEEYLERTRDGR